MTTNDQAKPRVPSVEEIMRCHRLMMRKVCNQETYQAVETLVRSLDVDEISWDRKNIRPKKVKKNVV